MEIDGKMIKILENIEYFSNCKRKTVPNIKYEYEFVTEKKMIKSLEGTKWGNLRLEIVNELTGFLFINYNEIYCREYNKLIDLIKTQYLSKIETMYTDNLNKVFGNAKELVKSRIQWDILHIIVADTFKNYFNMEFYYVLLEVYKNGQFPCGWHGKYPYGSIMIF